MKKSIFLFFAAILCAMSVSAKVIYLKPGPWQTNDGATFGVYAWKDGGASSSVAMTLVPNTTNVFQAEVTDEATKCIFLRMNNSKVFDWSKEWNRKGDLNIPSGKNCCTVSGWGGNTENVSWSTYTPPVTHTFTKNSTLYIDFRNITDASKKGANYPKAGTASGLDYSANAGGTVIPVTFTADVKWTEGAEFMKTEKSNWASIPFKAPATGQNCAQVAADGKSYTWTIYSEPSVTLSLDKTEADAGTNVTVTLTATADNVSGEVTYAFQYSTDNVTWNDITATGNTVTQTFAAETRYYKVSMTNGGTTKEATAKFSAIKFHVIGSWDSWAAHNEVVEGSKTITLEANKTYEYKITNGTWDLSWGNNGTMDRDNCTDWTFETTDGNAKIKTDEAGDYVFNVSRNAESKVVVSVTYPELSAPIPTFDYYIVGSFNGDDPKKAENGMTLDGTVYKATVTLAAGDNTLKVTKGSWDPTWGYSELGAAYEEVSDAGEYNNIKITLTAEKTITVVFNAATDKITFEGLTEKTPAEPAKCYLMGIGGDWTTGIEMEEDGDQFKLLCQPIAEGEQFKFKYGDIWSDGVENYDFPGIKWVDDDEDGNSNITLPAGNYNFYYKKETNQVYIAAATDCETEPETYTRTVTPGNYGTICLPYGSSSYSGAEFYEVSWLQKSGETPVNLYLDQLADGNQLVAGKPYIFRATSSELTVTYTGEAVAAPVPGANGLTGSFDAISAGGVLTGNYVVAQNKFWTATATAYADENRAYINATIVPTTEPAKVPGRRRVSLGAAGENAETGIDNIITTGTPVKVIENGQLIIIRDGVKYNVQGQKL